MSRRRLKVPELPAESIGAFRNMDDADLAWKRIYGERPPATRMDIAPQGWSKVRWVANKVIFIVGVMAFAVAGFFG
jgi:hypothetical protein